VSPKRRGGLPCPLGDASLRPGSSASPQKAGGSPRPLGEEHTSSPSGKAKAKGKAHGHGHGHAKAKAKGKSKHGAAGAEDDLATDLTAQLEAEEAARNAKLNKEELERKAKAEEDANRWINFIELGDASGRPSKLLLSPKLNTTELRKKVSSMVGVPMGELVLEINGHELVEARELPLRGQIVDFNHEVDVIKWRRFNRLMRLLSAHGLATINNLDRFERSAIHFAAMDGDLELAKEIMNNKQLKFCLVNKQDIFGDTGLHHACILGYADIVELMLDKQANPEIQNLNRRTPTHLASEHGHGDAIRALLHNNASLGPNPGVGVWKYPNAEDLATLNGRLKVTREIAAKRVEEAAQAELERKMAEDDVADAKDANSSGSDNSEEQNESDILGLGKGGRKGRRAALTSLA